MWLRREREHVSQECQASKERNDRQQLTRERHRSRSNSGGNAETVRGRKIDNQTDILETDGSSHNKISDIQSELILFGQGSHRRVNKNRGTEGNFYNLRNWATKR